MGYCGQEVGRLRFASGGSKIMGAYIAQGVTVGLDDWGNQENEKPRGCMYLPR